MSSIQFNSDKIENFKTLVVSGEFYGSNTFTFDFNNLIEFVPDEIVLNCISFIDESTDASLTTSSIVLLSSDLVNNYTLCSMGNYGNFAKQWLRKNKVTL